jgi:SAM-dependent methyltransferase
MNELQKFVEWDVRNWSAALDFWLANSTQNLSESRVLELGTDYGGLSLWFASQGARVISSDLNGVRREAVERHAQSECAPLIEHLAVDATQIPFENEFDVVVFKSVLGGITPKERQARALREIHKALKPGGELFFAENLVASPVHMFFRRRAIKWGKTWRYVTAEEMREFLAPFAETRLATNGFAGTFGRTEAQRSLLALGDRLIFDRLVPDRWKYIMTGVARK